MLRKPFLTLCCALLLSACTPVDNYNAQAYQQLQTLEASYQRFLTDAAAAPLDQKIIAQDDAILRQEFDDALMLAATLNDTLRIENLNVLEGGYFRLHARLMHQNAPLSPLQAKLYGQQVQQACQLAIDGECLRAGAACHSGS
ncbi:hypothetical protein CHU32_17655 [Superficieibacter electus]|uniref:Lipoprotein n=1 Tax=Superficieibacter electus TaxID=2022662 RepID=A0A2P5GM00_9ENTR|nr:hypothetical protein [Superficieibacter electus]POP43049.1 hypothetical protein CHU33_17555 [Superficieibacter electus]POP46544.1 hypothetical protein CHU32_17655 [Superficieibacter electus]